MTYTVTFDRIGRKHDPEPLTVEAADADDLAEELYRKIRPRVASRDVEIVVDLARGVANIFCGFRDGGQGRIETQVVRS